MPRKRRAMVTGVILAGVLAAGGATAYASSTSSPGASPSSAASASSAKQHHNKHHKKHGKHHRSLPGVHGQATVKNRKTGQFVVREWQRGSITGVSGATLTVKSADGVSWTWTVEKNARITRGGKKFAESALKTGDTVRVVGRQAGSANDALRISVPTPAQLAKQHAKK
ncbi:hypothetical protein PV963_04430 [Streptomyces coeruleorubidus]|uniref:hypothetical protein n=1 Tax=Streptomyces coeruleorubidus TaxID=116188 RepID=UPI00237FBDA8|nr:hypothetical protein [Streptomyces coeruleorubidus]WDV49661.1 hypothetical protein PV963_04430 [Streptomyces coeruleorubidus]